MKEFIFKICFFAGAAFGVLFVVFPPQLSYMWDLVKCGFCTMRYRKRFRKFGKGVNLFSGISIYHPQCMEIGGGTTISKNCILEVYYAPHEEPLISIGNNCHFGEFTHLTCINKIVVGDGVLTGRFVLITDNAHGETNNNNLSIPPLRRPLCSKGPICIGNNVWIGDKVTILPGVTIGDGAIIAAGAVVCDNIPSNVVAGGVPAKVLKTIMQ